MELIYFFMATILISIGFRESLSKKSFVYVVFFPIFIYLIKELSENDRIVIISLVSLVQIVILSFNREKA